MRWINRASNLANVIIKANLNKALQKSININKLKIKMKR